MSVGGDAVPGDQLVDRRIDMKLSRFSGRDEEWSDWCLRFEAYCGLMGYDRVMEGAAVHATPIAADTLGQSEAAASKALWHLLVTWCDGKALGLVSEPHARGATRLSEEVSCSAGSAARAAGDASAPRCQGAQPPAPHQRLAVNSSSAEWLVRST